MGHGRTLTQSCGPTRQRTALYAVGGVILAVATACGTGATGTSARSSSVTPRRGVATPFRGVGRLSLASPLLPAVRMEASGTTDSYLLTERAAGQRSRDCFLSGGWRERVAAAGGGTTTLDLTTPELRKVLAPFLEARPGLVIGLAALRLPPASAPAVSRMAFSVSPAQLVAVSTALAPASLRSGAHQATEWAARTSRGPLRVTAWWSSSQRHLPRRVRVVINEHSGAGDETDVIAWTFAPGAAAPGC
jgi:hypothetical protein